MRFATRSKNEKYFLKLEMLVSKIDITGKILPQNEWISSKETEHVRLILDGNHKPSTINKNMPVIHKTRGQFIQFDHSDIETDAAQSTIPFLDAQPITLDPPAPLSGIGLFYKNQPKSGGFIAPLIYAYNYSGYIENNMHVDGDYDITLQSHIMIWTGFGLVVLIGVFMIFFFIQKRKNKASTACSEANIVAATSDEA